MRRYFDEEMRYLHEAGKEFAQVHPEVARYLNLDSVSDRDPYVERLFEGFAFLAGRVHERLDDELPQYTESLAELLFPHFLRPIPSCTVVELKPRPGLVQQTVVLQPGIEVRSEPVGDEHVVCRFTTTSAVRLQPLRLKNAAMLWERDGVARLRLELQLDRGTSLEKLELDPLRLYFHADASVASRLHLFCTRHVHQIVLAAEGGLSPVTLRGQEWVQPAGLGPEEGLVPYGANSFMGFRLMHEYMSFRRKFWFVDVRGLDRIKNEEGATTLSIDIHFDEPYPDDQPFNSDQIRLFCAPAVNLFAMDAEPIRLDGTAAEHLIVPSTRYRKSLEAYDVTGVSALEENTGRRHTYTPYFQYRHRNGKKDGRFYVLRRRSGPRGDRALHMHVGSMENEEVPGSSPETLSIGLLCTNGSVPRERIHEGMITQLAPEAPQVVTVRNLVPASLILYPPTARHRDFFWKIISHWSLNFLSIANHQALTGLLDLYDWTHDNANRHRIAGIRSVRWVPNEHVERGAVLRGTEVVVQVEKEYFTDDGDLNLFGTVLAAFLSMYATINSFTVLTIEISPSGKRYRWPSKQGVRAAL